MFLKSLFVICVSLTPVPKHLHFSTPIFWVCYPMGMKLLGCGYSLLLCLPFSKWFLLLMVGALLLIDSLLVWTSMCSFLDAAPIPCPAYCDSQLNIHLYTNSCLPSIKTMTSWKRRHMLPIPPPKGIFLFKWMDIQLIGYCTLRLPLPTVYLLAVMFAPSPIISLNNIQKQREEGKCKLIKYDHSEHLS